uniref:Multidrug resistance-associated protein 4 n=1 Tax=Haplochromis burtoni TaxID=8153 RepID=A0A3Q2X6D7_HAPBU
MFYFFIEAIKVIQPLLLGKIILFFENYHPEDQRSLCMAYVYTAAMSISTFGLTILQHLYYYHVQRTGMRIRVAMCHMIYRKALGLSTESIGRTTTGQIVNLLSNDVNHFDEITLRLHYLWAGPLQAMVIIVFLWYEIGPSCLAGVATIAVMMPIQTWFGKLFGIFRSKTAVLTDSRIRIMNEVVSGIRIIKMYVWEKRFSALVTEVRKKEISRILKSSFLRGLNMASFFASSKLIIFVTFTVYTLLGNTMTASQVFVTMSLYGTIKVTLTLFFPLAIEKLSETLVSIRRIKNFLLLEEIERKNIMLPLAEKGGNSIEIEKLTCYWDKVNSVIYFVAVCTIMKCQLCSEITNSETMFKYKDVPGSFLVLQVEAIQTIAEETRAEGNVSSHIYFTYFTAGCSLLVLMVIVFLMSIMLYYLVEYPAVYQIPNYFFNIVLLCLLLGLTAAAVVFGFARSLVIFHGLVRSAQTLHNSMFSAVLHTPVSFFDVNPIGRILNRFSKDVSQMDSVLPITFVDFYQLFLQNVGVIAVAASVIPLILIPVVPLLLIFLYLRSLYLRTSRDIKRLESTTRSPVLSQLSSSLNGLSTIRASRSEEKLKKDFDAHQDLHSEAWFLFLMTSRWFALRLDSICSIFITLTAFGLILLRDGLVAGEVGLVLTYAVTLMGNFQWTVRQSAEVENMMTSVERVVEYTELKNEGPWETQQHPPSDWLSQGMITFDRVNFFYNTDGPPVLKEITVDVLCVRLGQVGIVGRTGAGKSSLVSALFRLAEPQGKICIDGVVTSEIGLHDLRQKMSIIPQDPVLFTGTVRTNLDPFNQHRDEDLWKALEEVQLKSVVEELPGKLEAVLAESGSNFSVGQRQLVCLARAILRKNRILIIDEATANVDPRTDELIQKTIRDKFKECTVITIAHRLNTIIDSDRILVLESGTIQEFDHPFILLQNKEGALYRMVQQTGQAESASLLESARQVSHMHRMTNGFQ